MCVLFVSFDILLGIDTGAVLVDGGRITFEEVEFNSNSLLKQSSFPNLRHNIFVFGGAVANVQSIVVDTDMSYFIYVSENSILNGLEV